MLSPIFSTNVYKQSLGLSVNDRSKIKEFLNNIFNVIEDCTSHSLEKDGGKSTHSLNRTLHHNFEFNPLIDAIYPHLTEYYKNLHLSPHLKPVISSMWANSHTFGAWSDLHIHSVHHLVGCYYLDFSKNSGDLLFLNPMEYHYNYFPFSEHGQNINTWTAANVQQDDLILFPAFLKHKTEKNQSCEQRISINFNIDFQLTPSQTFIA